MFERLNSDWIKCGQISLFVSATRKSSDCNHYDLGIRGPIIMRPEFTDAADDADDDDDDDDIQTAMAFYSVF